MAEEFPMDNAACLGKWKPTAPHADMSGKGRLHKSVVAEYVYIYVHILFFEMHGHRPSPLKQIMEIEVQNFPKILGISMILGNLHVSQTAAPNIVFSE